LTVNFNKNILDKKSFYQWRS